MIVLDSNVYISALNFRRGNPYKLLSMAVNGDIEIAISDAILQEVLRVLHDKFHATPDDLQEAEELIASCTERVHPNQTLKVIVEDPDDDRILECAVACGAEAIVTGDNDLLRRATYMGIRIMRVSDFLDRWR